MLNELLPTIMPEAVTSTATQSAVTMTGVYPTSTTGSPTTFSPRNYPAVHAPPSLWIELHPIGAAPAPRREHASVYDAVNDRLIVFGGRDGSRCFNDTWLLTNASGVAGESSWIRLNTSGVAPQRYAMLAGYNSMKNVLVIFGGADQDNFLRMDLWVLTNANGLGNGSSTWRRLDVSGTPPTTRGLMGGVYDEERDMFIFFGGGGWRGSEGTIYDETWTITQVTERPTWQKLNPSGTTPVGRVRHSSAYDSAAKSMIIFGGNPSTENPPSPSERMDDAWILAYDVSGASSWTKIETLQRPPAREGHTAVMDSVNKRMIVFGGAGVDRFVRNDVWILADVGVGAPTWAEYETGAPRPTARTYHSAVYTGPEKNRMIVFGGDAGGGRLLNDVWILRIANGVPPVAPNRVTLKGASLSLYQGYSMQLNAVATDLSGNEVEGVLYVWNSSNPDVATVTSLGLVRGVAPGTATITASAVGVGLLGQFTVTIVFTPSTTSALTIVPTRTATTTTTSGAEFGPLTGIWEGNLSILSTSRIKGGEEFASEEITASIRLRMFQNGSEVWGEIYFKNVQESILFNYAPLDYVGTIVPPDSEFEGTVNPDGSITFTRFWFYGPFTAEVAGDVISANFNATFVSEDIDIIILHLPGHTSRVVTGYTERSDIVSFDVHKVST